MPFPGIGHTGGWDARILGFSFIHICLGIPVEYWKECQGVPYSLINKTGD